VLGTRGRTFWIGEALPFGARASGHSLSRSAPAPRRLALTQLGTVATHYFDYPLLELPEFAVSWLRRFERARENLLCATSFCPPGAVIDFPDRANGTIDVMNKPGRAEEVQALPLAYLTRARSRRPRRPR